MTIELAQRTSSEISERFRSVRAASEALSAPLQIEDYVVQPMADASPTKWHLAHTTWFFETFILKPHLPEYREFHPYFWYLFNSYYNTLGERHERSQRGLASRPTVAEVYEYRHYVDEQMCALLARDPAAGVAELSELGIHHEQQHQELLLTDIKYVFWMNPLRPAYQERTAVPGARRPELRWLAFSEEVAEIGFEGTGFTFDNETPRHRAYLHAFELGSRLVTNEEFLTFMKDGGYERPELWLSDGWTTVRQRGWRAPLYWEQREGAWLQMTLSGMRPVEPTEPVCHISHYEADAYSRWAGARLPTEFEWERVASPQPIDGNFVEEEYRHPVALGSLKGGAEDAPAQLFGDVWEWTASPYVGYPGYRPPPGAVGEYNGKFMSNQLVLRGGSCATPRNHIRATYRNFFPPDARWQFSGLRLARDA